MKPYTWKEQRQDHRDALADAIERHAERIAWCVELVICLATLALFFTIVVPILPAGLALLFG